MGGDMRLKFINISALSFSILLNKSVRYVFAALYIMIIAPLNLTANAQDLNISDDILILQQELVNQDQAEDLVKTSEELVIDIETVIKNLDVNDTTEKRIYLDLWKLKALADIGDAQATADFALEIYNKYNREDYSTEVLYGDTMQQLVQALSKTLELNTSFEIVQTMRESVYQTPSSYLNFIIDKSLMEIFIETFDYERALEIELSMFNNPD